MSYKTYNNFLTTDFFNEFRDIVLHQDFSWYRRNVMTPNAPGGIWFTYNFYNKMNSNSEFYVPYIIPILEALKAQAPLQIRANMFISKLFERSGWHTDYDFECKTAIFYLNDCDGGTELKSNNQIIFIKAEANKMLVFDTLIPHRAVTAKQEPIRYVINFNYF